MKPRLRTYGWWLAATLVWMIFIFAKSAETYQEQDMRPFIRDLVQEDVLRQWIPQVEFTYDGGLVTYKKPYDFTEFIIRKAGHVSEFALLAFLWIRTLLAMKRPFWTAWLAGGFLAVLYAASDEWHQSFVPGRTGHAIDVGMDSVGVLLVMAVFAGIRLLRAGNVRSR
ncbi:hypothetical protein YDYSY3_01470 [Paenibacillus chitinolyticus]|uniref:VanZ family protein n=1 Tax=Paenibacillus chitinolyticus TaxID=79263 RepID=UPI0026E4DC66|nr:VanZ family protein [Paenibacillus chitinolyticus]GKS09147.1 hypothetical protein YDYSY3_01470 [Paenibacillus chitinolyticus]